MSNPLETRIFTFGTLPDGRPVEAVRLSNGAIAAVIMTYGATLQSLTVPDRYGVIDDIVLGHDLLETYLNQPNYLGATVGRCANRIAGGQFDLNGVTYRLSQNDGGNSLHGGIDGFDKRLWTIDSVNADDIAARVRLSLISPDGDQGYPGELRLSVTYTVTADDKLLIDYEAQCDRPTLCNPTNHALFNLGGARQLRSALDAELTLFADAFTPVDDQLIPTGERRPVARTAFDFMTPHR